MPMLYVGPRQFELVRPQSGFHVELDTLAYAREQQTWRMEAHFVPDEEDAGPAPWQDWEYWRLLVNPISFFRVKHWHDLHGGSFLDEEGGTGMWLLPTMQNLIHLSVRENKVLEVELDEFRVLKRDGHLFTVEMEGEILPAKDEEESPLAGSFRVMMEIPFATVRVSVPINASDPLAAARAIAAREIGLKEVARSRVRMFDPESAQGFMGHRFAKHVVTLETGWRG